MSIQICPEARYAVFSLLSFDCCGSLLPSGTCTNAQLRSFLNAKCQGVISPKHPPVSAEWLCHTGEQGTANRLGTGSGHFHPGSATLPPPGRWARLGGLLQRVCLCSASEQLMVPRASVAQLYLTLERLPCGRWRFLPHKPGTSCWSPRQFSAFPCCPSQVLEGAGEVAF